MDEEEATEAPASSAPDAADASPEVAQTPPLTKDPGMYTPIYIMTGVFAVIFIFFPFFFKKSPHKGIIRCSIMIAAFSMWLFWVTVYIAQMNPLLGPRMKNTTLAWMAHTWGNKAASSAPPAPAPAPEGGGGDDSGAGDAEAPPEL